MNMQSNFWQALGELKAVDPYRDLTEAECRSLLTETRGPASLVKRMPYIKCPWPPAADDDRCFANDALIRSQGLCGAPAENSAFPVLQQCSGFDCDHLGQRCSEDNGFVCCAQDAADGSCTDGSCWHAGSTCPQLATLNDCPGWDCNALGQRCADSSRGELTCCAANSADGTCTDGSCWHAAQVCPEGGGGGQAAQSEAAQASYGGYYSGDGQYALQKHTFFCRLEREKLPDHFANAYAGYRR
jgi:hypothetical protein